MTFKDFIELHSRMSTHLELVSFNGLTEAEKVHTRRILDALSDIIVIRAENLKTKTQDK